MEGRVRRAKELSSKGENEWMEAEAELRKLTIEETTGARAATHVEPSDTVSVSSSLPQLLCAFHCCSVNIIPASASGLRRLKSFEGHKKSWVSE